MDLKIIKQVIDLMKRAELSEFEFEEEGFKLRLCRKNGQVVPEYMPAGYPANYPPAQAQNGAPAAPEEAPAPVEDKNISIIKSPMVGTFYRAGSPESPAFTDVGKKVTADSTVCIIEAMKVMNEIPSEIAGTITEVLVENGESVEYGQPLFKIKTA